MTSNIPTTSLYVAHEKIYPREVKGKFQNLRNLAVISLLGLYYLLPWIQWDGHQAILFDLPARKFYIFSLVFWPQDFIYLTWLLVIAAMTLFVSTALAGRLWCGYACPQTVWTELFIWLERWTEGSRNQQMKLDQSPWSLNKLRRKSLKQLLWISLSAWTGFTFVGYFTPILELSDKLFQFQLGPWETFWIIFYGFATYGNAGFMRDQVCKYMCPYARFQSAMFDQDTLIISYDEQRGEARGKRKKDIDPATAGLGDCVDCQQCVQVCPTGIDIRDGLQYECIACAACIDVCNQVMNKMNYAPNLIGYTTQHAISGSGTHIFRTRMIVYLLLWSAMIAAFFITVLHRTPLDLDIIRDRNALYQRIGESHVENVYTLKVMNKDNRAHTYTISVSGLPNIQTVSEPTDFTVAAGEVYNLPLRIRADIQSQGRASHKIALTLSATDGSEHEVKEFTRFLMPIGGIAP